jgi:hypothetical protein
MALTLQQNHEVVTRLQALFPDAKGQCHDRDGRIPLAPETLGRILDAVHADLPGMLSQWHAEFRRPWSDTPTACIPVDEAERRLKLIRDEVNELEEALITGDTIGAFDAVLDITYAVIGAAGCFGMAGALEEGFTEVHRSNMTKERPGPGEVVGVNDKAVKGPNYERPNLAPILVKHGWVSSAA